MNESAAVVDENVLLANFGPAPAIAATEVGAAANSSGSVLVVLDDDPTGTQTVADVYVLTSWAVEDLRWALHQRVNAFYVLTNTRSLDPETMERRNREIIASLGVAAHKDSVGFTIASRSDSTLRGHFPRETDVLADALNRSGVGPIDGLVVAPAYIDAGRFTIDSVHYMRTPRGLLPVGLSEFARDPTFGYSSSDLRAYVEEKTLGRWKRNEVVAVTLADLRSGVDAVTALLCSLRHGRPAVVDAVCDEDLRVLSLAGMAAEARGVHLLYRVGPSFVRARAGLDALPPLSRAELAAVLASPASSSHGKADLVGAPRSRYGLVVVGSHVPRTTRQLSQLEQLDNVQFVELPVPPLLTGDRDEVIEAALSGLVAATEYGDVVLCTSRELVGGDDAGASLAIAHAVSAAVVEVVSRLVTAVVPRWIVAKGGITSSDLATDAVGIRKALVKGTLLPGIVSLWEPIESRVPGVPYVVFAGNVGDDGALAEVVRRLRGEA